MPPGDTRKSGEHRPVTQGSGEYVTFGHLDAVMNHLTNVINGKATSGEVQMLIQTVGQLGRNQQDHSERIEKTLSGIFDRCQHIAIIQSEEKAKLAAGIERCDGHHVGVADLYDKHDELKTAVDAVITENKVRTAQEAQAEKMAQPRKTIVENALGNVLTAIVMGVLVFIGNLYVQSMNREQAKSETAAPNRGAATSVPKPAAPVGP